MVPAKTGFGVKLKTRTPDPGVVLTVPMIDAIDVGLVAVGSD